MSDVLNIFLLSLLGSVIALFGGVVFLLSEKLSDILEENSIPFASGVLLTVALLGLLPEAHHQVGENVFVVTLASFVGAYLFENVLFKVHHHHSKTHELKAKSSVPIVIFGDTIHNLIDGVAIASSYLIAPGLGLITAISTFLHEVPHEVSDFGILLKAGWKKSNIFLVNLLSASTTILGAFTVFFFIGNESTIGYLLSISAGLFLYLGASDFLPDLEGGINKRLKTVAIFLLGILVIYFSIGIVPHSHEEPETTQEESIK